MLEKLFYPTLEPSLIKMRQKAEIFDSNPELVWVVSLFIGLLACLLVGFNLTLFGLLIFLGSYLISAIALTKNSTPEHALSYQLNHFIVFGVLIFLVGLGQSLASSFIIFSMGALFISQNCHNNLKIKNPDFEKGRAFHHPSFLIGEYEIIIFIILGSLFSEAFSAIAGLFAIACWVTISIRGYDIFKDMKIKPSQSSS